MCEFAKLFSKTDGDGNFTLIGEQNGEDAIPVMSFNLMAGIKVGDARVESVIDTILKYRPSVVGVQEATDMWIGLLNQRLGDIYTIVGDGESQEGQVWEAAMFAAHYKLDNLCAFVDNNGLQIDGEIEKVMNSNPIDKKFEAFGWNVQVIDGHDFNAIEKAVEAAEAHKGAPSVIIMKTVKGKGVSYMENKAGWHGAAPNKEQYEQAMADLAMAD